MAKFFFFFFPESREKKEFLNFNNFIKPKIYKFDSFLSSSNGGDIVYQFSRNLVV